MPKTNRERLFGDWVWLLIAAALLIAALVFWWHGKNDATFVSSVLGIVAWFWRQRNRFRAVRIEAEHEIDADQNKDEPEDTRS